MFGLLFFVSGYDLVNNLALTLGFVLGGWTVIENALIDKDIHYRIMHLQIR
jgi:hypothetical protein